MKLIDLTNRTFGELVVIGRSENSRNGQARWHVKCSCGAEKTVYASHLTQGNTVSCGHRMRTAGNANFKGYKGVTKSYFSSLLRGARGEKGRSPLPFELTIEYIAELLEGQHYKCALSGLPIATYARGSTASLDRIDSSKGYIEGNVQWLHKDVNFMKRHYSQEYFKHLCKLIAADGCVVV